MENNPIKDLLAEHDLISEAALYAQSLRKLWETDPAGYAVAVRELVRFFREYCDGFHHSKEERFLFPALRNHPDFMLQDLLTELEQHHADFRDYVRDIELKLVEGDMPAAHRFLMAYCSDLLDHVAVENDELFVMAESLLDNSQLETMHFNFMDVDRELGEERKNILSDRLRKMWT